MFDGLRWWVGVVVCLVGMCVGLGSLVVGLVRLVVRLVRLVIRRDRLGTGAGWKGWKESPLGG